MSEPKVKQRFEKYRRLEPRSTRDLQKGFESRIADPLWFLGKQWLMGEHQGENASTPVKISCDFFEHEIEKDYKPDEIALDPQIVPAEAIVESEAYEWWTWGRRIRVGASIARAQGLKVSQETNTSLLLNDPPPPYERFKGQYDGLQLYLQRDKLNIADSAFPSDMPRLKAPDYWQPDNLYYSTEFRVGSTTLDLPRHTGGHLEWYSVNANQPLDMSEGQRSVMTTYPTQLDYPGAPARRWWEIEDSAVDIAGMVPDRTHFATLLLIDLIVSHSDDWFVFPIHTSIGNVVTVERIEVRDSFGDTYTVPLVNDDWTLFKTKGLDEKSVILWETVMTPLTGDIIEHVQLGTDEYSNVIWAVEKRVNGRDIATPDAEERGERNVSDTITNVQSQTIKADGKKQYRYIAGENVLPYWHPYLPTPDSVGSADRRYVQGALANINGDSPNLMPEPQAEMLYTSRAQYIAEGGRTNPTVTTPPHLINPATIPINGMELQRRWTLARGTDGRPVLWAQRVRKALMAPPAKRLRFDVLREQLETSSPTE